jgi:glucose/arabinose dehydrogenase
MMLFGLIGAAYAPPALFDQSTEKNGMRVSVRYTSRRAMVAVAILAICGCDRPGEKQGERQQDDVPTAPSAATSRTAPTEPQKAAAQSDTVPANGDVVQRRAALEQQIEAAQMQQTKLAAERERLANLVSTHQARGEAKLAEFKAQLKDADTDGAGDAREQLAERARNELETALMTDQEYQVQLAEAEQKVADGAANLSKLKTELASLRGAQR